MNRFACLLVLLLLLVNVSFSQLTLLDSAIMKNKNTFQFQHQFKGEGWNKLMAKVATANYVMIGEDHFISEIPLFTRAIIEEQQFDNYVAEMDPWMLQIFYNKISQLPAEKLNQWISDHYNEFSFFQKKNEFELLPLLMQRNIRLLGTEQIGLMSTTSIFEYLMEKGNKDHKAMYTLLRDSSAAISQRFFTDLRQPHFMKTKVFTQYMNKLDTTKMGQEEAAIVEDLWKSQSIYKTENHNERIRLMQKYLFQHHNEYLKGKKNLFKFGANHCMKGESYIPVYDIGTTAHVMALSENTNSYHILILPKKGKQAGFLNGEHAIETNSGLFKELLPLFNQASDTDWTFIELDAVRKELYNKKYKLNSNYLEKTIKGYDAIVIIPESTPAAAIR